MNGALFAGLSGTVAFQERLDVVGNNIANSNTIAYKESRTTFADALYQTLEGGRAGSEAGLGGADPLQIGSGVSLSAVSVNHRQGSLERTGQPLDCAIEGEGMLVLSDGQGQFFTRDGSLMLDDTNTLVSAGNGYRVLGWTATDGVINSSGVPGTLTFDLSTLAPPVASSEAQVAGNLDSTAAVGHAVTSTISIFDSLGEMHEVELTFTNTPTANEWTCDATCGTDTATVTMTFDASGALIGGDTVNLSITHTNGAASPQTVAIDLSAVTSVAQVTSVAVRSQDGRAASALSSVEIADDGFIMGSYADGRTTTLGQLAMASFSNPGGLQRIGANLYAEAPGAGMPSIGAASTGGRGRIVGGSLEMSNVDLTRSFVDMITTQRGFQASTRVIATANEMLDDVVRLIRT